MAIKQNIVWLSATEVHELADKLNRPRLTNGKLHGLPKQMMPNERGTMRYHWQKDVVEREILSYKKKVRRVKKETEADVESADVTIEVTATETEATPEVAVEAAPKVEDDIAPSQVLTRLIAYFAVLESRGTGLDTNQGRVDGKDAARVLRNLAAGDKLVLDNLFPEERHIHRLDSLSDQLLDHAVGFADLRDQITRYLDKMPDPNSIPDGSFEAGIIVGESIGDTRLDLVMEVSVIKGQLVCGQYKVLSTLHGNAQELANDLWDIRSAIAAFDMAKDRLKGTHSSIIAQADQRHRKHGAAHGR